MRILSMLLMILVVPMVLPASAHDQCSKAKCEETKQRIKKIESKRRQGYSVSQGEKMQDELRRLRKIRSKRCR